MFLTRISVAQPVFATMIMVALMVIGIYSFQRLPIEQLPDVDFPVVAVVVSYPGASPEAVETDIIEPIEEAVNTISGIDSSFCLVLLLALHRHTNSRRMHVRHNCPMTHPR